MKRLVCNLAMLLFIAQSFGCSGMIYNQAKEQHPVGCAKIAQLKPECAEPSLKVVSNCMQGAEIFEAKSPEKATTLFIKYWEQVLFGTNAKRVESADMHHDIVDAVVYGGAQTDSIRGLENITIPALSEIYKANASDYSKKMDKMLTIVEINSKSSYDTFRDAHLKAIMN